MFNYIVVKIMLNYNLLVEKNVQLQLSKSLKYILSRNNVEVYLVVGNHVQLHTW